MRLSVTHISASDWGADLDIRQSCESSPDHGVPRWWTVLPREVSAKLRKFDQVLRETCTAYRRQDPKPLVAKLKDSLPRPPSAVRNLNPVKPSNRDVLHVFGDRDRAVLRESIYARSNKEVGSYLLCGAEQFIDIALTITDVHQPRGGTPGLTCFLSWLVP